MTSKDLRIGNYLTETGIKKVGFLKIRTKQPSVVQISGYELYRLTVKENQYEDTSYFQPIPLSGEWLLKLGLELLYGQCYRIVDEGYQEGDSFTCVQAMANGYWSVYFHSPTLKIDAEVVRVKHVHQLQNLIYAMTGRELQIKASEVSKQ